tara:strand:- start:325 stop:675 length:351 start_codon:yes stop_codon:yes gene_type:complete
MIKIGDLLIGGGAFLVAHIMTFYQLNGQFIWKSFQKHEWAVATFGIVLSFFYIWGTKYTVSGMGGLLWPARFIGFGIGMIIYALFVGYHFNEGISAKTLVSLCLALLLVCIQVLWK